MHPNPTATTVDDLATTVELARSQDVGVAERSAAFAVLVDRFQDMAFGYAKSILGDTHLAQESFLMAYAGLRQR